MNFNNRTAEYGEAAIIGNSNYAGRICNLYVASCAKDGGIYRYHMFDDGRLELAEKTTLDYPMYMVINNNKMYIVLREPFNDSKDSGVIIYDMDKDGKLLNPSEVQSTMGVVACHISADEDNVYCANYVSGSIIKLPDVLVQHQGRGIHPKRQEGPHAHFIGFTPDYKYVCAVDLGLDTIFVYDKNLNLVSKASVPEGHGARHIAFSRDGKYMFCANELKSTVSAFAYNDGRLEIIDTISVLPQNYTDKSTVAAIRFYDDKIYVSNRGHNSVSQVSFGGEKLILERNIDCMGASPRDFNFVNNYMICTNEESNNITLFDCKNKFTYVGSYDLEKPLCVNSKWQ